MGFPEARVIEARIAGEPHAGFWPAAAHYQSRGGGVAPFDRLALGLVEEGGFFVTASCSGLLQWPDFQQLVRSAAGSAGRRQPLRARPSMMADASAKLTSALVFFLSTSLIIW